MVDVEDLRKCYTFFLDEKRSTQWVGEGTAGLIGEEEEDNRMEQ